MTCHEDKYFMLTECLKEECIAASPTVKHCCKILFVFTFK